jgi:hypothetical protein
MPFRNILGAALLFIATAQNVSAQSALAPCPSSRKVIWTECRGSYTYDDWSKYTGEFKDDKRHGQGSMVYPDGQIYTGGFANDRRDGAGVYTSPNGSKWTGEFKNDKPNGHGVLTDKTGKVLKEGLWADGAFVAPATNAAPPK